MKNCANCGTPLKSLFYFHSQYCPNGCDKKKHPVTTTKATIVVYERRRHVDGSPSFVDSIRDKKAPSGAFNGGWDFMASPDGHDKFYRFEFEAIGASIHPRGKVVTIKKNTKLLDCDHPWFPRK